MTCLETNRCDCNSINAEIVKKVQKQMPPAKQLFDLANLFKVLGDPTRVRILYALFTNEMCVCDIAVLLNMTKSSISHQLRILKQTKLVKNRKDGKIVYYSLDDDHIEILFNQGLLHVCEV